MKSVSRLPPPPQQINDYLNGHIIGHYVMKKALSVAIYNHFSNISISRYKNWTFLKDFLTLKETETSFFAFPVVSDRERDFLLLKNKQPKCNRLFRVNKLL